MNSIGEMSMPVSFRYLNVYQKGKPQHDRYDPFQIRHPQMPNSRRAKIFSPFDALKGFNEAVSAKTILYKDRLSLSLEEQEELDRRLSILHNLTFNSRLSRMNQVEVSVTYYEECKDVNNEAYGLQGQYKTITGICMNVDGEATKTILVNEIRIPIQDILKIDSSGDIFQRNWEDQSTDW